MEPLCANPVGLLRKVVAHGDFVRFPLGETICYLINRPTHVGLVLVENSHRLRKPPFLLRSNQGHWGDGLTTLDGVPWRERRALLRPAFRARTLPRHLHVTAACTEEMLATLRLGTTVRLRTALRTLVARIAARTLFDAELEGFGTAEENRQRAGIIPFEEAFGEDFTAAVDDDPPDLLSLTRPRAPRRMESTLELIDARIRSGEDRGDMLSFLLAAPLADGSRLSREEIAGELIQMLYSGHLTIPLTLSNFWYALWASPAAAHRVHDEATRQPQAFPSTEGRLPSYCESALKETMRMFPPAPILYREVATSFEVGEHTLEEGAAVWISPQL
ncbi:MAG: cytochrome P450, partial [Myxococcales bacterium]|nr:cytochrome P450 [Myxococcales bacterium]